ncbi:MAG: lipid A biosynthesis acyltransferase [Proteobacteria bacterium]|nr:lipid A biosynthesis acyltransferase [Pseudomonadota bacterium]MDA0982935.1 lipid A biosynthesis acyltransferase [Pseudomonadota bacterium]
MSRLIFGLLWLAHFLPPALLAAVGEAVGAAAFWLIPERRRVTRLNLGKCFPQMDEGEREQLARAHFRAFVRGIVERGVLWWGSRERVERMGHIEGLENLKSLAGKPVILLAPHFAGLDAGFARLACEVDMVSMYANQKDARFSALLLRGRTRFGNQRLVSRQEGIRVTLLAMKEGRPFYYLPDQDYGPKDALFVPFFGVPAATVQGLSRLARLSGAAVLTCSTRMLPGAGGYVLRIGAPWDNFPTDDLAADTRRMNQAIEQLVQEMPEQYNWMHKRFKTRPAGEARFY